MSTPNKSGKGPKAPARVPGKPPEPVNWDSDLLGDFLDLTLETPSPEIFKLWSGLTLIGGALERRCFMISKRGMTYANPFTMLVASPGVGKGVIEVVRDLWADCEDEGGDPVFSMGPDSITKAALIDRMARSQRFSPLWAPEEEYRSVLCTSEEISNMFPKYDTDFVGVLSKLWTCKRRHEEERRHNTPPIIIIKKPCISLLMGAQPGWLAQEFPEAAWGMGFASRTVMVYSAELTADSLVPSRRDTKPLEATILRKLLHLSRLWGEFQWDPEAFAALDDWQLKGRDAPPIHPKLDGYRTRRTHHLMKLCMIVAVSRTGKLHVTLDDFYRAKNFQIAAEATMPDIFKAMHAKNESELVEIVHTQALTYHIAHCSGDKYPGVPNDIVYGCLINYTTAQNVKNVVELAEKTGLIVQQPNGLWLPTARQRFFN